MQVTQNVFDFLLNHMMDLHKRKLNIVRIYSQDYEAYTTMLDFLNQYIKRMNDFLDRAEVADCSHGLPFVVLGSLVYTKDDLTGEEEVYRIDLPGETHYGENSDMAVMSYICPTPQSKALLFKKPGEKTVIKEGKMTKSFHIKRIEYRANDVVYTS